MKIFYYGFFNAGGGLEKFAKRIVTNYRENKIEVCLLVVSDKFSYKEYFVSIGCEYVVLPSWSKHPFKYFKTMKHIFKKANIYTDTIHLNLCSMRNYPLIRSCQKSRLRTIITSHYSTIKFGKGKLLHYFNRLLFKNFGIKVAVSIDAFEFMFGKAKKPTIIGNSIDSNEYIFNASKRQKLRQKLKITNNDIVIIQVGRLFKDKNPIFSLRVFAELQKRMSNVKLFYVGSETEKETRYLVEKHSIKNVVFVGKVNEHLEDWYSAGDILFLPSLNEAASLTLLEAMSNGIDTLCSNNVPSLDIDASNVVFFKLKTKIWCDYIYKNLSKIQNRTRVNWISGTKYDKDETEKHYWRLYEKITNKQS